jgi:hypothetical protein
MGAGAGEAVAGERELVAFGGSEVGLEVGLGTAGDGLELDFVLARMGLTMAESEVESSSIESEKLASRCGTRKEPWQLGHLPRLPAWKSLTCNP